MSVEGNPGSHRFTMDTTNVPEDVNPDLAAQRTALIEDWRTGETSAEDAMRSLMALYWDNQKNTNGSTNVYLMQSSYQFPAEAGMDQEVASEIYTTSMKGR